MTRQHGHGESPPIRLRPTTRGPQNKITEQCTPRHHDPVAPAAAPAADTSSTTQRNPQTPRQSQDSPAKRNVPTPKGARARIRQQKRVFTGSVVGDVERAHLVAGVGAQLHTARDRAGLSRRRLAALAGCTDTTVARIEAGTRRPRASMLSSLASVLDADGRAGLLDELTAAAGGSLAAETPGGTRRRRRRVRAAGRQQRRANQRARVLLQQAHRIVEHADDALTSAVLSGRGHAVLLRRMTETHTAQHQAQALRAEAAALLARTTPPHSRPDRNPKTRARALGRTATSPQENHT